MLSSVSKGTERKMVTFMEFSWFDFSGTVIHFKGFVFTCRFVFLLNVFKHMQGGKKALHRIPDYWF